MKLDSITNKLVENFLKDIYTGGERTSPLVDMQFLSYVDIQDIAEKKIRLFERLSLFVKGAYQEFRKVESLDEGFPCSKLEAQKQIRDDFGMGNSRLEAISALYYRYFSQVELSIEDLAKYANVVPQQFRRRLNIGLAMLVDEIRRLEMTAIHDARIANLYIPLPDYSSLVGVESLLAKLTTRVAGLRPGQMVSVEGMGGIGKTALVHAFVAQDSIKQNGYEVLWVSARQPANGLNQNGQRDQSPDFTLEDITNRLAQQLGLSHLVVKPLEERLKGIQAATTLQKYLLVIDNLETVEDYVHLIPAISRHAGNCKIIITTRKSLREFPYVSVFPVPELTKPFVFSLLESEASRRGRNFSVTEQDLQELVETVGGLPLAIKLIAAQVHLHPLAEILNEFKHAGNSVEQVYRFLYWKIWNALSEPARKLLFTFLTSNPEGEDAEFTAVMSGLDKTKFTASFNELDEYSLIETNALDGAPKFRIHRLTATFLQTEILKEWDLEANAQ